MNFLEQLIAEWYEYNGYFMRINLKFGKNANRRGVYVGKINVVDISFN